MDLGRPLKSHARQKARSGYNISSYRSCCVATITSVVCVICTVITDKLSKVTDKAREFEEFQTI